MLYLFLSILLNAYLGILFAYFKKYKIDIFQAIVFNYGICVLTGSIFLGTFPVQPHILAEPYFRWALAMGFLFISVFNLIGISSVKVGITITQTSNKLSFVIPVLFSYFLYQEQITPIKIAGIAAALIAVLLVSTKPKETKDNPTTHWEYTLPFVLFVSSGIIDTLTKYVEHTFLTSEAISNTYLITGFLTAFLIGISVLGYLFLIGKRTFNYRNLLAGIVLGVPNYFSIYYLVKALQSNALSSSAIIPINNITVLFVVSLFGIFVFNEKLSKLNYIGLILTIMAILLIFAGDKL
jgi:drug/metabolite transporter (DMT)-like permease